jgi:hypothetical protein
MRDYKLCPLRNTKQKDPSGRELTVFLPCAKDNCEWWTKEANHCVLHAAYKLLLGGVCHVSETSRR